MDVDDVPKEELGPMYVEVPGFFQAFGETAGLQPAARAVFKRCKEGDNPVYREESDRQCGPPQRTPALCATGKAVGAHLPWEPGLLDTAVAQLPLPLDRDHEDLGVLEDGSCAELT